MFHIQTTHQELLSWGSEPATFHSRVTSLGVRLHLEHTNMWSLSVGAERDYYN